MAHNLANINGINAMAYLDATPWHGLGQKLNLTGLQPNQLIDAAIDAAQLRWSVGSLPMFLADGTPIPGHACSVRYAADGIVAHTFGPVGDAYRHIQNVEACAILQPLATDFGCVPAAAGVLGNGERCWLLMRLGDATITPVKGDDVRGYFLLHWDHTGNMTVQGMATGIRVVCQNTLTMATSGRKASIAVKHTSNASQRLDEAAGIMRKLMATLQATGDTFATLAGKVMTPAALAKYIEAVIPNTDANAAKIAPVVQARRDTVARLVFAGRGAAMANQLVNVAAGEASLWAAYNAVTEYFDHVRPAEAKSDAGRINAQQSAVFGGNAEVKAVALDVARQLVAA